MSNVSEILEFEIYPNLNRAAIFHELLPKNKGNYFLCKCPKCKKEEAYIYKNSIYLHCSRLNNCGYKSSIWDYVQKENNYTNQETLYALAQYAGHHLPSNSFDYSKYKIHQEKAHLLETLLTWATDNLLKSDLAKDYLKSRGIVSEQHFRQFDLGYIPSVQALIQFLSQQGFNYDTIQANGLVSRKWEQYPIIGIWRDRSGSPKTMWGRSLDPNPPNNQKYNLLKGEKSKATPFMLHKVTKKEVVIVEGFFDAIALNLAGEDRAVAIVGTKITEDQLKSLANTKMKRAILCLDEDRAGKVGTERNIENLAAIGITSYVMPNLPDKKDPDNFIQQYGLSKWQEHFAKAKRGVTWKVENLIKHTNNNFDKDKAIEDFFAFASNIQNPIDLEEAMNTASKYLEISKEALKTSLSNLQHRKNNLNLATHVRQLLRDAQNQVPEDESIYSLVKQVQENLNSINVPYLDIPVALDTENMRLQAYNAPKGKSTGYALLDEVVTLMPSELIIVAARPRHGKTSFACNLLMNWIDLYRSENFVFFSYEVNKIQLFCKLIALLTSRQHNTIQPSGYSYREVMSYLNQKQNPNPDLENAIQKLQQHEHQIYLVNDPAMKVEQLISYCENLKKRQGKIGAIIVDYIELVKVPEGRSEELRIAAIVNKLRIASQLLDTPVIALAQMNRTTVTGGSKQIKNLETRRPVLEGLRYSGRQEQEASTVIGLFNRYIESSDHSRGENAEVEGSVSEAPLEIITHKNRYGESNRIIDMVFNMFTGNIEEKRT